MYGFRQRTGNTLKRCPAELNRALHTHDVSTKWSPELRPDLIYESQSTSFSKRIYYSDSGLQNRIYPTQEFLDSPENTIVEIRPKERVWKRCSDKHDNRRSKKCNHFLAKLYQEGKSLHVRRRTALRKNIKDDQDGFTVRSKPPRISKKAVNTKNPKFSSFPPNKLFA